LPFERDDALEMRVCWRIPMFYSSRYPDWYVYVDVLSGEIICTWQLLIG